MDTKQRPLKILSLPVDKGGCGWYRVRQPFDIINEYSDSKAHVIDKDNDDPEDTLKALIEADILVMRQGAEAGFQAIKQAANDYAHEVKKPPFHAKTVMDIDDNIELISPYSPHYEEYGTREFYDENSKQWIWKDGVTINLAKNRSRVMNFLLGMRKVDMISTTTEKLAEYARQYNPNVAILPNAIDTRRYKALQLQPNKPLRVGWAGGASHYEDWVSIREPINKLLRKYKFTLVMAGAAWPGLIDEDLRQYVEVLPWFGFEAYSYAIATMALDIALIPLADLPFNHYKSAIKLYEFSAIGVPSVVSNILPYSASGIDSALYYSNLNMFTDVVDNLINAPLARKQVGEAARKEVLKNWTAQQHVKTYLDTYRSLL